MDESVFVPGFQQDIFVSYAHVDNEPDFDGEDGWVSIFKKLLTRRLRKLLGRDCFSAWQDQELAKHIDFEPQIVNSLESSATLLLILSPGYLKSPWCRRELQTFLKLVRERGSSRGGVFIVLREKIDHEQWPDELDGAGLTGYRFWTQESERRPRPLDSRRDTDRGPFFDALNDLANEMADCLQQFRNAAEAGRGKDQAVVPASKPKGPSGEPSEADAPVETVFLAETTDDIDPIRSKVKRHLEQSGLRVLPSTYYPRDPDAFSQAVQEDLAEASVFVQLLSPVMGRPMPDCDETYVAFQYRAAGERQLPILQWRDPELLEDDIEADVEDPSHRQLLLGATVEAVDIEDFKHDVIIRAKRKEPTHEKPPGDAFVFVNTANADCRMATDLCQYLDQRGFGYSTPIHEGKPEDIREDLRENVLTCDGMIVVYGASASNWVRGQLLEARKAAIYRSRRLHAAVYEGPPTPKLPLGFKLPRMHVIPCHGGLDEERLQPFLEELVNSLTIDSSAADVAVHAS